MNNLFLKSYSAEDIILNNYNLKHFTNLFWKDVVNNLDPNKKAKFKNILFTDKLYNFPDFFFYSHFSEDFYCKFNKNKILKDKEIKFYFNKNQEKLISTFCFVYNLDQTLKNKLYLLHFNHKKGIIYFFIDYHSCKFKLNKKISKKQFNSLKIYSIILNVLKNKHKNILDFNNNRSNRFTVQFSSSVLNHFHNNGLVNITFNSKNLFKISTRHFKILIDKLNISFSLVDFNDKNLPPVLKDFLIIDRNNNNRKVKIGDIIFNYNKLVESRQRKINKY